MPWAQKSQPAAPPPPHSQAARLCLPWHQPQDALNQLPQNHLIVTSDGSLIPPVIVFVFGKGVKRDGLTPLTPMSFISGLKMGEGC